MACSCGLHPAYTHGSRHFSNPAVAVCSGQEPKILAMSEHDTIGAAIPLAETVQALQRRLAAAEAELHEQGRQQQALAQGISHDLRAPLRSIDSFSALLGQQLQDGMDQAGRDYLQRIRDAAARMGALLDSLQQLSLAGRSPLRYESVDLSMLADWVGAGLQDADPGREARIEVAPSLSVQGDERLLKGMLEQLLDNAWKFSSTRERVEIEVDGSVVGDRLQLRIRDRGIGFDAQYADKLFEPFQRLHHAEEGAGAGIGLAIAQCIAQRHGGRIHADSTLGEGSVFHVELPMEGPQEDQADG